MVKGKQSKRNENKTDINNKIYIVLQIYQKYSHIEPTIKGTFRDKKSANECMLNFVFNYLTNLFEDIVEYYNSSCNNTHEKEIFKEVFKEVLYYDNKGNIQLSPKKYLSQDKVKELFRNYYEKLIVEDLFESHLNYHLEYFIDKYYDRYLICESELA